MARVDEFIAKLEAGNFSVRQTGAGEWRAQCPAHEDREPSLGIKEGDDGRVLLKCRAGCPTEDVVACVGWSMCDLFADADDAWKEPPRREGAAQTQRSGNVGPSQALPSPDALVRWQETLNADRGMQAKLSELRAWAPGVLRRYGVGVDLRDAARPVVLPVRDELGDTVGLLNYQPNPAKRNGTKLKSSKGSKRNLFPPPEAVDGDSIWLLEGESDALTVLSVGIPAVGIPGVEGWRSEWAARFAGRSVIICTDCDEPGRALAPKVAADLLGTAGSVRVLDLDPERNDGYDVGDCLRDALTAPGGEDEAAPLSDERRAEWREYLMKLAELQPLYGSTSANGDGAVDIASSAAANGHVPAVAVSGSLKTSWPAVMGDDAYHGLAGVLVRSIEPHTEASNEALLVQFLAAFGNACKRGAGVRVEGDFHATNLYVSLVGETSKGRKGTSWGQVRAVMEQADPEWTGDRIIGGLSSGEGLINAVRNARVKTNREGDEETEDEGVADKRLLAMEGEFARVLRNMRRDSNTLSATLRELWDRGDAQTLTKSSPIKTTGALVSIIAHCTSHELKRELTETDAANGFANRFLFVCTKRSKILPFGGNLAETDRAELAKDVKEALRFASVQGPLAWGSEARKLWASVYPQLSEGGPGLYGAVTGRAEAQTLRLAVLYALLEQSQVIGEVHLRAALAVWEYCDRSARYVFGGSLGDAMADTIHRFLRERGPAGATRTEIRDYAGKNVAADRIDSALSFLADQKLAHDTRDPSTGGRPAERWLGGPERREKRGQSPESRPEADFSPLSSVSSGGAS